MQVCVAGLVSQESVVKKMVEEAFRNEYFS